MLPKIPSSGHGLTVGVQPIFLVSVRVQHNEPTCRGEALRFALVRAFISAHFRHWMQSWLETAPYPMKQVLKCGRLASAEGDSVNLAMTSRGGD
jgi:hypothetical protein